MARWLTVIVGLTFISSASAQKVKVERGVIYSQVGGETLRLDIATPTEGKGPYPAVLCVHGGAWRGGHRAELSTPSKLFFNRSLIEMLAEQGYVAATISYRLAPRHPFPAQIIDCKSAVRWLRANAKERHIDPERIGAVGFSAGGHLVCLLAACCSDDGFDTGDHLDHSSAVNAVVSFFPPTDLSLYADNPLEESIIGSWLGGVYKEKPELFRKASPLTYCKKACSPILFIHGTEDIIVPVEHSRRMAAKLKELGVVTELVELEGESHGWVGAPAKQSGDRTFRFLAEHLKP